MEEPPIQTHSFKSENPEEVSDFIEKIYADNYFRPQHTANRPVCMIGQEWNGVGIYDVNYEMPFVFTSEAPRPNYLFLSCTRGGATYSNGLEVAQCTVGDVMPISANEISKCTTNPCGFEHVSTILSGRDLHEFLIQWIGQPIIEPIRFDLRPLNTKVAAQWNAAASCLRQMMNMSPLPDIAARALYEYMLKLVVVGHGNNYSALIMNDGCAPEHVGRSAISMIESDPVRWNTLGMVAHALGCPTSVLQNTIQRLTGQHAEVVLLNARLHAVRQALAYDHGKSFVGTLNKYGFNPSSRFIRLYRERFNEPPSATYRRNPNAIDVVRENSHTSELFSITQIDQLIDQSMGKPIGLSDIARHVGLTEHATIAVFKYKLSITPIQYVIERRLERARWLLCNTSASILSIAIKCGFGSQSYMTTLIKRQYGMPPRQLRLSSRGQQIVERNVPDVYKNFS
ncbi:helix-turn-helix transcriptional regulator [Burkholderia cenocepacia]|uniref:helix-turn-helix transcriptional regulator n=1 Tax=Burkholderia cenocepacia TaxID=95486 RepID=UPI002AB0972E|nr:helix-turn-helix domain-containing protein [Burkholderia cenocepacia]